MNLWFLCKLITCLKAMRYKLQLISLGNLITHKFVWVSQDEMHIFIFDTTASHVKFTCKHQNKFIDEGKTRLSTNLRSIEFPNALLVEVLFKICFFYNCRKCIGYDHKIKCNIMIITLNSCKESIKLISNLS